MKNWNDFGKNQTSDFDKSVAQADKQHKIHMDTPASLYEFATLVKRIPHISKAHILDIGCGTGRFSIPLATRARKVTAVDLSSASITILKRNAKKRNITNIDARVMDFFDVPSSHSFDYVLMVNLIHHVKDANALMQKVSGLLNKNGALVIFEFNPLNLTFYLSFLLSGQLKIHLTKEYFRSNIFSLHNLMRKSGFHIESVHKHSFLPTRFIDFHPIFITINTFLNSIPIIREFCAFHILVCRKD